MSKLLKAVEKAKREKIISDEKRQGANPSNLLSAKKAFSANENKAIRSNSTETVNAVDGGPKSNNPATTCELSKSYFTENISLDMDELAKNRILTSKSSHEFEDIYNLLRTQIFHRTKKNRHNVLMVTSAMQGEGKSITALNLAISIARELDQFALLVDTDMREPSLHKYLGIEMTHGLSDYLMKNIPVHELFIKPGIDKLTFLPAGAPIRGSTEILGSPKLQELIVEMKQRYPDRYVIFDCPDLLHAPDALVFSTYVDGIIFVVESGKTSRENVLKALKLLEGRNIIGLVLNKADKENLGND